MKFVKKVVRIPELYCLVALLACLFVGMLSRVSVDEITLTRGGIQEKTSFPISMEMTKERFQVEFVVNNPLGNSYDLKIIPDDCVEKIKIDGKDLSTAGLQGRCDYSKGFVLPDSLITSVREGKKNKFQLELSNGGGPGGLNLKLESKSLLQKIIHVFSGALILLLCLFVSRRLKLGWGITAILLVGVLLRVLFFANNFYTEFGHDVDGHVAYVQYVIENKSIPGVDDCWTCYHPPVYYVSAAPSFVLADALGLSGTTGLQFFSLLLSLLTLVFGILFLKEILSGKALTLGALLWTLWPLAILVSPRIGNDQMFYMLHLLCLWGGIKYLNSGRGKFLIVAVAATALAFWTKTTAVVSLGMLFLFACCGYVNNARLLRPSKSEWVAWGMFALLLLAIALQKYFGGSDMIGNASGLHSGLKVGTEAFNFLYFDIESFITHPFTSPWNDELGRQYFLNYTFKTSLFGEFQLVRTEMGRTFATVVSISFLGLGAYALRGMWKTKLQMVHWILLLQGFAFVGALAYMRYKYPYACSNDFRYIFPAVVSLIPFVAWGVNLEGASCKWKVLGYLFAIAFVIGSVSMFLMLV